MKMPALPAACAVATACIVAASPARAVLGQPIQAAMAPASQAKTATALRRTQALSAGVQVFERATGDGGAIREFVSPQGVVFAVAWSTRFKPQLGFAGQLPRRLRSGRRRGPQAPGHPAAVAAAGPGSGGAREFPPQHVHGARLRPVAGAARLRRRVGTVGRIACHARSPGWPHWPHLQRCWRAAAATRPRPRSPAAACPGRWSWPIRRPGRTRPRSSSTPARAQASRSACRRTVPMSVSRCARRDRARPASSSTMCCWTPARSGCACFAVQWHRSACRR